MDRPEPRGCWDRGSPLLEIFQFFCSAPNGVGAPRPPEDRGGFSRPQMVGGESAPNSAPPAGFPPVPNKNLLAQLFPVEESSKIFGSPGAQAASAGSGYAPVVPGDKNPLAQWFPSQSKWIEENGDAPGSLGPGPGPLGLALGPMGPDQGPLGPALGSMGSVPGSSGVAGLPDAQKADLEAALKAKLNLGLGQTAAQDQQESSSAEVRPKIYFR